jgi:hypothetical protein
MEEEGSVSALLLLDAVVGRNVAAGTTFFLSPISGCLI